ncbi:XRE family transcriptional regulator [Macrococcus canis]|nr:XRE family transcriptional regulator [Macrococcus canis]
MLTKDTINTLINSDISAYQISKGTGVAASGIQRIRSGERKIENLTLENAEKLYQYQQQLETTN